MEKQSHFFQKKEVRRGALCYICADRLMPGLIGWLVFHISFCIHAVAISHARKLLEAPQYPNDRNGQTMSQCYYENSFYFTEILSVSGTPRDPWTTFQKQLFYQFLLEMLTHTCTHTHMCTITINLSQDNCKSKY